MRKRAITFKSSVLVIVVLALVGCSGGGGNTKSSFQSIAMKGTVTLPTGSTLDASKLQILTNTATGSVGINGNVSVSAIAPTSSASTVVMITNSLGNPVLLKQTLANGSNNNTPIDANSTAESLVLYDPVFLKLPASNQAAAKSEMLANAKLPDLVSAIENAITSDPDDPLNPDTHSEIFILAAGITQDILAKLAPTTAKRSLKSVRMTTGDYVGVKDDEKQVLPTVTLVNDSYVYYDVDVTKNDVIYKTPTGNEKWRMGRKTPLEFELSWDPIKLNRPVTTDLEIGDGSLAFTYTKLSGLTIFEELMNLGALIVGVSADSIEDLEPAYKTLIESKTKMAGLITTIATASPNTHEEAVTFVKGVIWDAADVGVNLVVDFAYEYFKKKLTNVQKGYCEKIAKFFASKAVLVVNGSYSLGELGWTVYHTAKAPATYSEKGTQAMGMYPAQATITAVSPVKGAVGTTVTITGTGFGSTAGTVLFGSGYGYGGPITTAVVSSWSDTQIRTTVPVGASMDPASNVYVVTATGLKSQEFFQVISDAGTGGGTGATTKFTNNGNGTITQNLSKDLVALNTKLLWQQVDDGVLRTWDDAKLYCENLNLGGYSGWTLPTLSRLSGILDTTKSPTIDDVYFTNTKAAIYWSGTVTSDGYNAAYIDFADASSSYITKNSYDQLVRCVRTLP